MSERTPFRLTEEIKNKKANDIVAILRQYSKDNPCPTEVLMDELQLSKGQISTVIKHMRRSSCNNLDRYINYYPISSKRGYFLPSDSSDFVDCYITLALWICSLAKTIKPMEEQMIKKGINWREYIPQDREDDINYLDEIPEMNKDTSWFMDN